MIDLLLTSTGDISFESIESSKNMFQVNFITSKTKALKINFYVDEHTPTKESENSLEINFNILKPLENKAARTTTQYQYLEQSIRIRLQTVLGDLKAYPEMGSKLELLRHESVDKQETITKLKDYVYEAVKDLIPTCSVEVYLKSTKYYNYTSGVSIIIRDNQTNATYKYNS